MAPLIPVLLIYVRKDLFLSVHLLSFPGIKKKTRITLPLCPTSCICHVSLVNLCDALLDPTFEVQLNSSLSTVSHIDRFPAVSLNAVGPVGSRYDVIQVSPDHTGAAGTRPIDLSGRVVKALVCEVPAAKSCSNRWRKVDVAFIWLVHLRLIGEQDLGL